MDVLISSLIFILIFPSPSPLIFANSEKAQNDSQSIYENVYKLKNDLEIASKSVILEYWKSIGNDTSNLANWKAYSKILEQINYALFDILSEDLMQSDLIGRISEPCEKSLTEFLLALVQQESWAYKVLDSSGFVTAGILDGSFTNFGDFDECLNAGKGFETSSQYCLVKYHLKIPTNQTYLIAQDLVFNTTGTFLEKTFFTDFLRYAHYFKVRQGRSGLCFPAFCTNHDIQLIIDHVLKIDRFIFRVDDCQKSDDYQNFSPLQITILSIISFIWLGIILVTFIEMHRNFQDDSKLTIFLRKVSIRQNLKSLVKPYPSGNLGSINGLRVLTMFWLVYGHAYLLSVKEVFRSSTFFIKSLFDMKMYFLFNAWPVVDIFFIMSAFLHSYRVFSTLRTHNQVNILKLICNRIARLWPSLWIIVGLVFIIPNIARGPLWPEIMNQQVNSCYQNWWRVITFTANLRSENNLCHIHTWYLSADVQLFLFSFIIIFLIHKFQKRAVLMMSISNLVFCSLLTVYFYVNRLHPTILFNQIDEMEIYREMFRIYMPAYLHLTPYLVGIFTGYLLVIQKENSSKVPKVFSFFWILSISLVLLVIMSAYLFTTYPQTPLIVQSIYAGFHRLVWSLSIAFIIFFCEINQKGFLKDFLSSNIFASLSKLCYLIYLTHFIITWTRYAYTRQPLIFSHLTMFNVFIINSIYSVGCALIIYLFVEAPISNIYNLYLGQVKWKIGEIRFNKKKSNDDSLSIEMK